VDGCTAGLAVVGELERGADAQVLVGGRTRPVPGRLRDHQTIVVSVATGADAALAMIDTGRTQTVSLGTGKRGTDAVTPYYTTQVKESTAAGTIRITQPHVTVDNNPDNLLQVDVSARIELQPYTESGGWSAPGRAQLACTVSITPHMTGKVSFDTATSIALRTPDGHTLTAPAGTFASPNADTEPAARPRATTTVTFDVPETVTTGTLLVHPTGTIFMTFDDRPALYNERVKWGLKNSAELAFDLSP
jgi:hypothetical protein